ncbi:cytochrome c oxidase subunit IV [Haloferula luteola]|uniref:Cytochrome c oxidase subunit IV n=1 Tax=Haloferula luteola TaxID=595692 RepID=A0A840VIX4_9BACT|nr:cytochrome C oxidase subunit IV family protein [Haloferula luteola]MBB5353810.1 cytochrome c oxidase subunit IV [Haloferula luteola]
MADSAEDIKKAFRLYILVGIVLFAGTLATVAVATVPWLDVGKHGFDTADLVLGLLIAATKASLVAAIFMHLNHEKPWVYWLIGMGAFFGIAMAALIFLAKFSPIHYDQFNDGGQGATTAVISD